MGQTVLNRFLDDADPLTVLGERPQVGAYFLAVFAVVAAGFAVAALRAPVHAGDVAPMAGLVLTGLAGLTLSLSVERALSGRRGAAPTEFAGTWAFAAALLLPAPLAATVAFVVFASPSLLRRMTPSRAMFNAATMSASTLAAVGVVAAIGSPVGAGPRTLVVTIAAGLTFAVTNYATMAGVLGLLGTNPRSMFSTDNLAASATEIGLGAFVAATWHVAPWLLVFALPLAHLLHRTLLHPYLEEAAHTDVKTGLVNAARWA